MITKLQQNTITDYNNPREHTDRRNNKLTKDLAVPIARRVVWVTLLLAAIAAAVVARVLTLDNIVFVLVVMKKARET